MNEQEFQKRYHNYSTFDEAEVKSEANKINASVLFEVEAVELPPLGWCIMLKMAKEVLDNLNEV